jgi:acyl-coenzyme A synthetase/AMP-(fatty) acid ligase
LKAVAAEELARFTNVRFHFLPQFPRNDRGKVLRHELKQQILSGQKG